MPTGSGTAAAPWIGTGWVLSIAPREPAHHDRRMTERIKGVAYDAGTVFVPHLATTRRHLDEPAMRRGRSPEHGRATDAGTTGLKTATVGM